MKAIELSNDKKAKLMRAFGVSRPTVWAALNYITQSSLAKRIRRAAIIEGGRIIDKPRSEAGFVPNCETRFEHKDGQVYRIFQRFANGVVAVQYASEKKAAIYHDEKEVGCYRNVTVRDWNNILFEAQSLSESLNEI